MPVRIHQLVAVIGGLKAEIDQSFTNLAHIAGTPDLFTGMEKNYRLIAEVQPDGNSRPRVPTPAQVKKVRVTARQVLSEAQTLLTRQWDTARTLDEAQAQARADVVVDGVTVMTAVTVRHLLYLEGELTRLNTLVAALPVLDGAQEWTTENAEPGQYKSARPLEGTKSDKVLYNWHRGNGTDKFQETVDVMTRDEPVEATTTVNYSGALPAERKAELLVRLSKLRVAVKMAREEANAAPVTDVHEGEAVFSWLLQP